MVQLGEAVLVWEGLASGGGQICEIRAPLLALGLPNLPAALVGSTMLSSGDQSTLFCSFQIAADSRVLLAEFEASQS